MPSMAEIRCYHTPLLFLTRSHQTHPSSSSSSPFPAGHPPVPSGPVTSHISPTPKHIKEKRKKAQIDVDILTFHFVVPFQARRDTLPCRRWRSPRPCLLWRADQNIYFNSPNSKSQNTRSTYLTCSCLLATASTYSILSES